jgi:hypothetical protein
MKYYLFIDESGDHGLVKLDPGFTVFLLCGIIINENDYQILRSDINIIKQHFWHEKEVIFHSRDIRKWQNEFQILIDQNVRADFYRRINDLIKTANYTIIASAIKKDVYIKNYGKLSNDVYELALSFIIERAVFFLDTKNDNTKELEIIIEKRGKKEDQKLSEHFQRLSARGTGYVSSERLHALNMSISFKDKKENINGLQLADLIAYPTARFVMEPNRANPAYELFQNKIYSKNGKLYGLKIFP